MPHHWELKYWSNGIRRCDMYPEKSGKTAKKSHGELTSKGTKASLSFISTTWNMESEYREIRKGTIK